MANPSSPKLFSDTLYVTTPLYYVNALPHIGHSYATILGDVIHRYAQSKNLQSLFLTGTDEHGDKIADNAAKNGKSPIDFATEISDQFRKTWDKLGLKYDIFYRTTQPSHYELVQSALTHLKDKGEIYFASYEGKYCRGCERFRTDQEWTTENLCPDHNTPPELRKESNYFFKMSAYQQQLQRFYQEHPEALQPTSYLKEVLSFLDNPLEDLCISRPKERLQWGIPLPFDDKYVTYVWFDALLNYIGGLGYRGGAASQNSNFQHRYWDHSIHIIGKDILKTHAIYWPTMLMALGFQPFQRLQVSGYWLMGNMKMSKSLGNVVSPVDLCERFGVEPLRYYLLKEMSYGQDSSFSWDSFILRSNADLANGIGNLASRTLTLTHKNFESKVPSKSARNSEDRALLDSIHKLPALFEKEFEACRYHIALSAWAEKVAECDRYINEHKPWALAKDLAQRDRLGAVLGTAMDALWTLGIVMSSTLPEGAQKLAQALGRALPESGSWSQATETLTEGSQLGEIPRLYPRLELPKEPS